MNTPYSYTTKEQRIQLKAMPDMTGGRFNRFFDNYQRRLVAAMANDHEMDNLKFQLSEQFANTIVYMNSQKAVKAGWKLEPKNGGDYYCYMSVPFGEQMIDDFVAIMLYVQKAIQKEKHKDEIQAAAKGMISFDEVRNQFKIIAEFRKIGARKVKVVLWRDFDLTQQRNTSNYVWGHWEMIEYKEYYTLEEIKDTCMKIVNYNIDWAKKRLAAAEVGLKAFENVGSVVEEKYEV
jgi:hypothetical protein